MVSGLRNVELAHHENDDESDGAMTTNLGIKRWSNPKPNSKNHQVEEGMVDSLVMKIHRLTLRAVLSTSLLVTGEGIW